MRRLLLIVVFCAIICVAQSSNVSVSNSVAFWEGDSSRHLASGGTKCKNFIKDFKKSMKNFAKEFGKELGKKALKGLLKSLPNILGAGVLILFSLQLQKLREEIKGRLEDITNTIESIGELMVKLTELVVSLRPRFGLFLAIREQNHALNGYSNMINEINFYQNFTSDSYVLKAKLTQVCRQHSILGYIRKMKDTLQSDVIKARFSTDGDNMLNEVYGAEAKNEEEKVTMIRNAAYDFAKISFGTMHMMAMTYDMCSVIADKGLIFRQTQAKTVSKMIKTSLESFLKSVDEEFVKEHKEELEDIVNSSNNKDFLETESPGRGILEGINSASERTINIEEAIKDVRTSASFTAWANGNSAAGQVTSMVLAATSGFAKGAIDGIKDLDSQLETQHVKIVDQINDIEVKAREKHEANMGQIDSMSSSSKTRQQNEVEKLDGIVSGVKKLDSAAKEGFGRIRSNVEDAKNRLHLYARDIQEIIESETHETNREISQKVAESQDRITSRVEEIQAVLEESHQAIISTAEHTNDLVTFMHNDTREYMLKEVQHSSIWAVSYISEVKSVTTANQENFREYVTKSMEKSQLELSERMFGVDAQLKAVDGKLVVLDEKIQNIDQQIQEVLSMLLSVENKLGRIGRMFKNLPQALKAVVFDFKVDQMFLAYENLKQYYQWYLQFGRTEASKQMLQKACESSDPSNLFHNFVRVTKIPDNSIGSFLEKFEYDVKAYESFGQRAIGLLYHLSFLNGICSAITIGSNDDIQRDMKVQVEAQMETIRDLSESVLRHVEERIPEHMIRTLVHDRIKDFLARTAVSDVTKLCEELRNTLQELVGDYTQFTVLHTGEGGSLNGWHLDQASLSSSSTNINVNTYGNLRFGFILKENIAVFWSNTKMRSEAEEKAIGSFTKENGRSNGIQRGHVFTSSSICGVSSSDAYYPRCVKGDNGCECFHFENFGDGDASTQLMTYFLSPNLRTNFMTFNSPTSFEHYKLDRLRGEFRINADSSVTTYLRIKAATTENTKNNVRTLLEHSSTKDTIKLNKQSFSYKLLNPVLKVEVDVYIDNEIHMFKGDLRVGCVGVSEEASVKWVEVTHPPSSSSKVDIEANFSNVVCQALPDEVRMRSSHFVEYGTPTNRFSHAVCFPDAQNPSSSACFAIPGQIESFKNEQDLFSEKMITDWMDIHAHSTNLELMKVGKNVPEFTLFEGEQGKGNYVVCINCHQALEHDPAAIRNIFQKRSVLPKSFVLGASTMDEDIENGISVCSEIAVGIFDCVVKA